MIATPQPNTPPVLLTLTYREAAESLQVSERTIWGLVKSRELLAVRIGRAVRIPLTELHAFLARKVTEQAAPHLHQSEGA
jgi:excisionase family DNA binding protein